MKPIDFNIFVKGPLLETLLNIQYCKSCLNDISQRDSQKHNSCDVYVTITQIYIFFDQLDMQSQIKSIPPLISKKITSQQADISFQQAFSNLDKDKKHFFLLKDSLVQMWPIKLGRQRAIQIRCEGMSIPFDQNQKEKAWEFIHSRAVNRIYGLTTFGQVRIRNHRNGTTGQKWLSSQMEYPSQYRGDHIQVRCSQQELKALIQGKYWKQLRQLIVRQQRSCQPNVVHFQDDR